MHDIDRIPVIFVVYPYLPEIPFFSCIDVGVLEPVRRQIDSGVKTGIGKVVRIAAFSKGRGGFFLILERGAYKLRRASPSLITAL